MALTARIILLFSTLHFSGLYRAPTSASASGVPDYPLCSGERDERKLHLAATGWESAVSLDLRPTHSSSQESQPCKFQISAPETHLLSAVILPPRWPGRQMDASVQKSNVSCKLSLLLGCDTVAWSLDLCDPISTQSTLNFTEMFPKTVSVVWTPPSVKDVHSLRAGKIIFTAIGKGKSLCSQTKDYYPCWRRPRWQPLCIANQLMCDGVHNCPLDGTDEDPDMCGNGRISPGSPEHATADIDLEVKRSHRESHMLMEMIAKAMQMQHVSKASQNSSDHSTRPKEQRELVPDTLSNYGPWGYLVLGMLACGAVLMLCGLWECCCRQPKANNCQPLARAHAPTTLLIINGQQQSGGVLSLESDMEDDTPRPPAYDDLEQPPSYGVLFPGHPKDGDEPTGPLGSASSVTYVDADVSEEISSSDLTSTEVDENCR